MQRHNDLLTKTPACLTALLDEHSSIDIKVRTPPHTAGPKAKPVYEATFERAPVSPGFHQSYASMLVAVFLDLLPQLDVASVSPVPGLSIEVWKNGGHERLGRVRRIKEKPNGPLTIVEHWVLDNSGQIDQRLSLIGDDLA